MPFQLYLISATIARGLLTISRFLRQSSWMISDHLRCGKTPLHYAAGGGHMDVMKYLIVCGCDPSCCDIDYNITPLHYAAKPKAGQLDSV